MRWDLRRVIQYLGSLLFCPNKRNTTKTPKGASARSCHQPLRFVSCSLLVPAASIGSKVASANNEQTLGEMVHAAALPSTTARKNHQYSVRVARPLKLAYLARQAFTASKNVIGFRTLPARVAPDHTNSLDGRHARSPIIPRLYLYPDISFRVLWPVPD